MRTLRFSAFIPALFFMFTCSPTAGFAKGRKQIDSVLVKQIRALIDSRDYTIDLGWGAPRLPWSYDGRRGNIYQGFLHISGDTLFAYTHQEEAVIYGDLPPKHLPRGYVSVKYKILDYKQTVGKKGKITINFTIDQKEGLRVAPVCYPLKYDSQRLLHDTNLHLYTYYTLQVGYSEEVQVFFRYYNGYSLPYLGALRL